jgi:hypothetical protein
MKTIDTKSLILGAALSVLFLALTSSKTSSDNSNLEIFSRGGGLDVFNRQSNTIYEYYGTVKGVRDKPDNIYVIAADGSSITISK